MKAMPYKFCLLFLIIALVSCKESDNGSELKLDASKVLATVNGEAVTQNDIDFAVERMFSNADQLIVDDEVQTKVLQSLLASKAMKQVMEKELSAEELTTIQKKTDAYREELFVKEYLVNKATPMPVNTQMVEEYYQNNLTEFGGGQSKEFEMLKTTSKPTESQRDAILANIEQIKQNSNWADYAQSNSSDLGLVYFRSKMQPGLLEPQLENALNVLELNKTSDVVFVKGVPHLLKVTAIDTLPAKPLSTVSASIRKKLAAVQLKKAVKSASDAVLDNAVIEYKK